MPVFNIYSIGDSEFLEQIMIAVAMITGTGDFSRLVSVGLLLGVLMITVQSLLQGAKEINFQQILIGWIMYGCFFGPTSTVTIEDGYTGQVRVVANVPIGVGFTGGVISSVGYKITKLFEQGYSVVTSITQKPFAEPLKILNETRRRTYDSAVFEALNAANGGGAVDFRKSWDNYIRECTLTKLDLGVITLEQMLKSPFQEAFRFSSSLYGTKLYLTPADPNGADYTCTDAWGPLIAATGYVNSSQVQQALAPILGIRSTGQTPTGKITDSLTALGASATSASNFVQMSLLEPLYFDAVIGKYQDMQDFTSAAMVNQAILQRNTQWAAEHSMFMTVVRPMMTFFEGFVYAITPIMAFIVVLGATGITMIGKYFQTVLWIQLWMPVLSIINLYIITAANGDLARFSVGGLNSLYALSGAGDRLDTWIATGGMLASATPVISLFIVTGSTYAFTTLASRVGGSDHLNEKISSPDLVQNGPVADLMPTYSGNQYSGLMREGTKSLMASASYGGNVSSGVSSSQARMEQAQQSFSQTLGRSITQGVSETDQFSRMAALGRTVGSMGSQQAQAISTKAQEFGRQFGLDQTQTDAVKGTMAIQASGGLDLATGTNFLKKLVLNNSSAKSALGDGSASNGAKAGLGLSAKAQGTTESSSSTADKMQQVDKFMSGVSFQRADSQSLTNQLAHEAKSSSTKSFASTWGDTASNQLSQAATKVLSSTDTYQTMAGLQQSLGSTSNMDMKTLGAAVSNSPEASSQLSEALRHAPQAVRQEAAELEGRYQTEGGMSPAVAQSAARLTAMTNANNYDAGDVAKNFVAAARVVSTATGRNLVPDSTSMDPMANANSATTNVDPSAAVKSGVERAASLEPNDSLVQSVRGHSKQGVGGPGAIYDETAGGVRRVEGSHGSNVRQIGQEKLQQAYTELTNKGDDGFTKVTAASILGSVNTVGAQMGTAFGGAEARERINAENADFARNTLGLTHSQAQYFAAARSGDSAEINRTANNLLERYADKDTEGNIVRNDAGEATYSGKNADVATSMLSRIALAARSDNTAAPAIVVPINRVNEAERNFQPR